MLLSLRSQDIGNDRKGKNKPSPNGRRIMFELRDIRVSIILALDTKSSQTSLSTYFQISRIKSMDSHFLCYVQCGKILHRTEVEHLADFGHSNEEESYTTLRI